MGELPSLDVESKEQLILLRIDSRARAPSEAESAGGTPALLVLKTWTLGLDHRAPTTRTRHEPNTSSSSDDKPSASGDGRRLLPGLPRPALIPAVLLPRAARVDIAVERPI